MELLISDIKSWDSNLSDKRHKSGLNINKVKLSKGLNDRYLLDEIYTNICRKFKVYYNKLVNENLDKITFSLIDLDSLNGKNSLYLSKMSIKNPLFINITISKSKNKKFKYDICYHVNYVTDNDLTLTRLLYTFDRITKVSIVDKDIKVRSLFNWSKHCKVFWDNAIHSWY